MVVVAETPKQPRRSIAIAARLVALTIGLAGAEGVLWFGGYPSWWQTLHASRDDSPYAPDADLGWRNRQGQFQLMDSQRNRPFLYTNWSQGRRATADRDPAPDAASTRVLFFGDSYVQGYGLSNPQTFEWMIQARHPELAVSNFGTANYGTYQSYLAIAKYIRGPCSAYYLFNGFHERRNVGDPDWLRIFSEPPPGLFFPFAELSGSTLRPSKSRGEMMWPVSRWLRTAALAQDYCQRLTSYPRMRNERLVTEALIEKMNTTLLAAGGIFTVILFDLTPDQRRDYRQFMQSRGIRFVDCDYPEMQDPHYRLPDGHPNEDLNRLLAQWIEPISATNGGENQRAGKL